MGYISKVKIPSETEAYDIFADKSLKDGDGNVISATYLKTADAPKIGSADTDNELKKIEYTEESAVPASPDAGTEYACTDFIGYNDLDSNLQEKIDSAISGAGITAGDGIVIDKNETGDGVEIKVDPAKNYLTNETISSGLIPVATAEGWSDVPYNSINIANALIQRDSNGNFVTNKISLSTPSGLQNAARVYEVGEVVSITAPAGATNGTLTTTQLQGINRSICSYNGGNNNNTWILLNNERYYPMSYGRQEGYRTYANVEDESNAFTIKSITVTLSTGAWVLNTIKCAPQLYRHDVRFSTISGANFTSVFITEDADPYTTETIVGNRSVSIYNSTFSNGLVTGISIEDYVSPDSYATITYQDSLTTSATLSGEAVSVSTDIVTHV